MKNGLIVFAREPVPGAVKTRLAAVVGDHAAAALYETMLLDVLKTARQVEDVAMVVFWACEEATLPLLAEKYRCDSRRQCQGDLGQRMQGALDEMFTAGSERCCIIGSDTPDLPQAYIREAYRLLALPQYDLVLGPCWDGGYYLIGMKQLRPQLFTNISWSSAVVLRQSLVAARDAGLSVALLPEWQDIDTAQDLQAFQERNRMQEPRETT